MGLLNFFESSEQRAAREAYVAEVDTEVATHRAASQTMLCANRNELLRGVGTSATEAIRSQQAKFPDRDTTAFTDAIVANAQSAAEAMRRDTDCGIDLQLINETEFQVVCSAACRLRGEA